MNSKGIIHQNPVNSGLGIKLICPESIALLCLKVNFSSYILVADVFLELFGGCFFFDVVSLCLGEMFDLSHSS